MLYCNDCEKLVEEGSTTESFPYEYWGEVGTHTQEIVCCSECGGQDIEDADRCATCGEEVKPGREFCENCEE